MSKTSLPQPPYYNRHNMRIPNARNTRNAHTPHNTIANNNRVPNTYLSTSPRPHDIRSRQLYQQQLYQQQQHHPMPSNYSYPTPSPYHRNPIHGIHSHSHNPIPPIISPFGIANTSINNIPVPPPPPPPPQPQRPPVTAPPYMSITTNNDANSSTTTTNNDGTAIPLLQRKESANTNTSVVSTEYYESSDKSIMAAFNDNSFLNKPAKTYKTQHRNVNNNNNKPRNHGIKKQKTVQNSKQQLINKMIPKIPAVEPMIKKEMSARKLKKEETVAELKNVNKKNALHNYRDAVYNGVCIQSILSQIKTAMDADPDPDRVKHENYLFLIREYFRCEISKYALDWFMHTIYKRYIKLHNAMFKYIRWNAMLQSTKAHSYGANSSLHDINVTHYPKLHCKQATSEENKLFRGPPPHKKRKLNMPKKLDIKLLLNRQNSNHQQRKRKVHNDENYVDFDHTMNKLQPRFQTEINAKQKDVINVKSSGATPDIQPIQPTLPPLYPDTSTATVPTVATTTTTTTNNKPIMNSANYNVNNGNNTRMRRAINKKATLKAYPLQLEFEGIDNESLRDNNVEKVHHHNEYTNAIQYICGGDSSDNKQTERDIKDKRNISSTNCTDVGSDACKALPCDNMYLSAQHIMEIGNHLIRRKNFLNNATTQRDIINTKEKYEKEWKRNQFEINKNQQNKDDFLAAFNTDINRLRQSLHTQLFRPINDPNIINTIINNGIKPFLFALHSSNISYNGNKQSDNNSIGFSQPQTHKIIKNKPLKALKCKKEMDDSDPSDTDSDEDIPINERLKNEKEQKVEHIINQIRINRKHNISKRLQKRLSIAPHNLIANNKHHSNNTLDRSNHKDNNNNNEMDDHNLNRVINPVRYESERKLQLAAMLNIEAPGYEDENGNECWIECIHKAYSVDGMADIPHLHQCNVYGISNCLLSEQQYHIPSKQQQQKRNQQWRQEYEYEANLLSMKHNNNDDDQNSNDDDINHIPTKEKSKAKPPIDALHRQPYLMNPNPYKADANVYGAGPIRMLRRIGQPKKQQPKNSYPSGIPPNIHPIPKNYDPNQFPSPHGPGPSYNFHHPYNRYGYGSVPASISPIRRGRTRSCLGVSGKGKLRKSRGSTSGKGVSGKSYSRNPNIGAKRSHRGLNPKHHLRAQRYTNAYSHHSSHNNNANKAPFWRGHSETNKSHTQSAAYRQQRLQTMYTAQPSRASLSPLPHTHYKQNAAPRIPLAKSTQIQRMRHNNSNTPLIHAAAAPPHNNNNNNNQYNRYHSQRR